MADQDQDCEDQSAAFRASGNYPFLNHSSQTLPNNLPPNVGEGSLARQKRKRTSPEDQAILEAAYNRDPKPDKKGRLDLVERVTLDEKEVQIWFQNRRQCSRRKSRPLLPHEIAQYQFNRSTLGFQATAPILGTSVVQGYSDFRDLSCVDERVIKPDNEPLHSSLDIAGVLFPAGRSTSLTMPAASVAENRTAATATNPGQDLPPLRYLANRRSAPSLRVEPSAVGHLPISRDGVAGAADQRLKKSSSFVRLAMTLEGKAEVVSKTASPSPPRPVQAYQPFSGPLNTNPLPRPLNRSSSGRSRDSRAWEFWCDKDTRSELEVKAEKDASGSAADAIDLLRSTSGRRILGAIPLKRNSTLSRSEAFTKRSRAGQKPASLLRSSTSLGRLQSKPSASLSTKPIPKLHSSKSAASVYVPGNESDKENWSPGTEGDFEHASEEAVDASEEPRSGLVEKPLAATIDNDPEADEELTAFMRGGRGKKQTSGDDDLDCVQGLLSLSQGNWR